MKYMLVTVVLFALACVGGCYPGQAGLVDSGQECATRYKNITEMQCRMAVDDWDMIWLYDRPSYLTEWHVRDAR